MFELFGVCVGVGKQTVGYDEEKAGRGRLTVWIFQRVVCCTVEAMSFHEISIDQTERILLEAQDFGLMIFTYICILVLEPVYPE